MMKLIPLGLSAFLCAMPAVAQDDTVEGPSLMEEGARLFLRGLMSEMEPAMDDLRGLADEFGPAMQDMITTMGPALTELLHSIDDIRNYDAPKVMPNGDIIIRRRPDAPPFTPKVPDGEIEL
jgi:hypothetical protein